MSSSFLSSHPDFTSPPPLGPLTLHPSLKGSFANNPLEKYHFRTVQRIIENHPELTDTHQVTVSSSEPASLASRYDFRLAANNPSAKMPGKKTMTWNGMSAFQPLTASKQSIEARASSLPKHPATSTSALTELCSLLNHPAPNRADPHSQLHSRSRRQAPHHNPQRLQREA